MRIRVLSDLHREFDPVPLPEVAADVVVLAGDIDRGVEGVTWARRMFPETLVLYVAGKHEHYGERGDPQGSCWDCPDFSDTGLR